MNHEYNCWVCRKNYRGWDTFRKHIQKIHRDPHGLPELTMDQAEDILRRFRVS